MLNDKDLIVSYCAAEYLYPLNSVKCIDIMQKLYNQTINKIDKYTIKTKIDGLSENQKFFIDMYKNIYGIDDLGSLNRENKEKGR